MPYTYRPEAVDPDGDPVNYSAVDMPPGMVLNASTGALAWTPAVPGLFPVRLRASDRQGGSAFQEFSLRVTERVGPSVEFLGPAEGQKLSGRFTVSGRCAAGSLNITTVQVRFDNGPWKDVQGLESWHLAVDTTKLRDGKHKLQARASDGIGWSEPVNRTVLLANGGRNASAFDGVGPALVLAAVMAAASAGTAIFLRRRKAA